MNDARSLLILLRSGAAAGALRLLLEKFGDAGAVLAAGPAAWRESGSRTSPPLRSSGRTWRGWRQTWNGSITPRTT